MCHSQKHNMNGQSDTAMQDNGISREPHIIWRTGQPFSIQNFSYIDNSIWLCWMCHLSHSSQLEAGPLIPRTYMVLRCSEAKLGSYREREPDTSAFKWYMSWVAQGPGEYTISVISASTHPFTLLANLEEEQQRKQQFVLSVPLVPLRAQTSSNFSLAA